jgi:hypothetical protein
VCARAQSVCAWAKRHNENRKIYFGSIAVLVECCKWSEVIYIFAMRLQSTKDKLCLFAEAYEGSSHQKKLNTSVTTLVTDDIDQLLYNSLIHAGLKRHTEDSSFDKSCMGKLDWQLIIIINSDFSHSLPSSHDSLNVIETNIQNRPRVHI